jgi:hypothetical protein
MTLRNSSADQFRDALFGAASSIKSWLVGWMYFARTPDFRILGVLFSISAVFFAAGVAHAGNLVVNGGFEDSFVSGQSAPAGWTYTPGDVGPSSSTTSNSGNPYYLFPETSFIHRWDEISQTVPTTEGQEYTLSFDLTDYTPSGPRGFGVYWSGTFTYPTCDPRACPAGVIPLTGLGFAYTTTAWERVTATFTAGPGTSSTIGFGGYSVGGAFGLDNVDLEPAAANAPEPANLGLLAVGMGCLVMRRQAMLGNTAGVAESATWGLAIPRDSRSLG